MPEEENPMDIETPDKNCIRKLFKYGLEANKDLKIMYHDLKEEQEKAHELEKKVSAYLELLESQRTLTTKIEEEREKAYNLLETEQRMAKERQAKLEQAVKDREEKYERDMKEKNKEVNKWYNNASEGETQCVLYMEERRKKVAQMTALKKTVEQLKKEKEELKEKNKSATMFHGSQVNSLKREIQMVRSALKLSVQWFLHFGKKLSHLGHLNGESDESRLYNKLNESIDTEADLCSAFKDVNAPVICQDPVLPAEQELHADLSSSSTAAPMGLVDAGADPGQSSREMNILGHSRTLDEIDRHSPSLPAHSRNTARASGTELSFKRSLVRRSNSVARRNFVARRNSVARRNMRHQRPSTGLSRAMQSSAANAATMWPSPSISLHGASDIEISFPLSNCYIKQTADVTHLGDRVNVRYTNVRDESIGGSMTRSCDTTLRTNNPERESDVTVLNLDADEEISVGPHVISTPISSLANSVVTNYGSVNPSSGHLWGSRAESHESLPTDEDAMASATDTTDSDMECRFPPLVTKEDVIKILETLKFQCEDKTSRKFALHRFRTTLLQLNKSDESGAVDVTVAYLLSRTTRPFQRTCNSNNVQVFFPMNEQCILKAYSTIGKPDLLTLLEDRLYRSLTTSSHTSSVNGLAALCRVITAIRLLKNSLNDVKSLCYEMFKIYPTIAPYLVANIAALWHSVILPSAKIESEACLYRAICYLLTNKPADLADDLWEEAHQYFTGQLGIKYEPSPDEIIKYIVYNMLSIHGKTYFSNRDSKNYITAIELLLCRFDWLWIYSNVMEKCLLPYFEFLSKSVHKSLFAPIALIYKLIGVIGVGRDENQVLLNVVKKNFTSMSSRNIKFPDYLIQEAYYTIFRLQTGSKVISKDDAAFKSWLAAQESNHVQSS